MKSNRNVRAALMMSAAFFVATPALAQETTAADAQVTPPPVTATVTPTTTSSGESATPVNPEAAAQAAAEDAERRAEARPARREAPARTATPARRTVADTPAAAAPAARAAAAAPATTPAVSAPAAQQPTQATEAAPAAPAEERATTTATTEDNSAPLWPLAVIGLLIVAAGAFFFLRRGRRDETEEVWAEPVPEEPYVAPVAAHEAHAATPVVAAPVAAMAPRHDPVPDMPAQPVAAEEISVARADSDDVAALTAADAPGDRPWLEFAMRPVRAGTNVDEAVVEIELTVGNAGNVAAEDVRISTFMLTAESDGEMERLLVEPHHDAAAAPMTIAAGEGARVDATLAMNRAALGGGAFRPVIVADARYRLPDGGEGRTSASFLVGGASESGSPEPIALDRTMIRDDVEATLYRAPERV
jgi:hypothetical protein